MSETIKTIDERYVAELSASVQHWRISYEKEQSKLHDAMAENYRLQAKINAIRQFIDWSGDTDDLMDVLEASK